MPRARAPRTPPNCLTLLVAADAAGVAGVELEADAAALDRFAHGVDRLSQVERLLLLDPKQVEGEPLGGLRTDSREPVETLDQRLDGSIASDHWRSLGSIRSPCQAGSSRP